MLIFLFRHYSIYFSGDFVLWKTQHAYAEVKIQRIFQVCITVV